MSDNFTKEAARKVARQLSYQTGFHKTVLQRVHGFCLEHMMFDIVHDFLITKEAFDPLILADIKDEPKTLDKIRSLLTHLKKADLDTYYIFKEALRITKQDHVFKRLNRIEKEVLKELRIHVPEVPSSPIAQPESIVSLSGGGSYQNIHEKENDGGS